MSDILWVGLSAQLASDNSALPPLSNTTISGKCISEIEQSLPHVRFMRTNLVPFAPVDARGKLRYPTSQECQDSIFDLLSLITAHNPSLVFLLGKQVSTSIFTHYHISSSHIQLSSFSTYQRENTTFIPIYHPAYIMIYKRKEKASYITHIVDTIQEYV